MPTARSFFYTAVVQGKIYALGGQCCTVTCQPLATVEIYNPTNDSWVTGTPMPSPPRWYGAAGVANGIIYIVGGQTGCGGDLQTNEAFDPSTNTWSTKAQMPTARDHFGIATVFDSSLGHEVLYAIGGFMEGSPPLDRVEMYDPFTDTWTIKQHMNQARYGVNVAAVNGKIYAIGGSFDHDLHIVEEYDPSDGPLGTWRPKADMPTTRGPDPAAIGVINGIIYVAGGEADNRQLSTVEAYNPVTNTWSTVPPMPTARDAPGGTAINGIFYAIGGILSGGAGTVGRPFIYQVTATNHPTSYDASGLPDGLSIDHTTGVIFGVPMSHVYDVFVPLSATNASGTGHSSITFSVQSAPPFSPAVSGPTIVSSTSATARTGQPFSFQVLTKNASQAARFVAGGLPPGLTINSLTGLISGTPTSDGNFPASISVTDGQAIANGILQLTIISDPTIPIITSSSRAILVPGMFFSRRLTADALNPIFMYIGTDGQEHQGQTSAGLPPGLSFNGIDTISGTYNPTPTPPATPGIDSAANDVSTQAPDTIKIRPLFSIEPTANNSSGTGVAPLDFTEPVTPTVATNAATLKASFSATLNGSVNPEGSTTTVYFEYGTTTNYGSTTPHQTKTGDKSQNLSANISPLTASTTYHFRIVATNIAGTTRGGDRTFTTLSPRGTPVPITNPASLIASSSARLNGMVDPHGLSTTVYFQYGTTTNYTSMTPPQTKTGDTYQNVTWNIPNLTANTTYHFRIVAMNSAGMMRGSDLTFTTLSAMGPPIVTTNPATNVASSSATLNGSLDPHGLTTTVQFQWGTTTSYVHTTSVQTQTGNTYRNIAANISGLTTHTTYHFRIVATNSAGTRLGSDRTFTTP